MRFDDYLQEIEKDTWYGPQYDRERLDDPNYVGRTVVSPICPSSLDDYALGTTEFFWKVNEGKSLNTLEIEELSCANKPRDKWHINRYVHAQRDMLKKTFAHFDGAAKVYSQDTYQERLNEPMPRNSKPGHYIKLFRIDGQIDLDDWQSLVAMFYKGNEMVIEYFDPDLFNKQIRPQGESIGKALSSK